MLRQPIIPTTDLSARAAEAALCRTCRHTEVCTTADLLRKKTNWHLSLGTCAFYDEDPRALTDTDRALAEV